MIRSVDWKKRGSNVRADRDSESPNKFLTATIPLVCESFQFVHVNQLVSTCFPF